MEYNPEHININTEQLTIEQLLNLDLRYQTSDTWRPEVKSRLIESIIIRIPLPALYIDIVDGVILDGMQRLSALKNFIKDEDLSLCGLEYFPNLLGKTFLELSPRYQRRILETRVLTYTIVTGTPTEVKLNIFARLNIDLDDQEKWSKANLRFRNC